MDASSAVRVGSFIDDDLEVAAAPDDDPDTSPSRISNSKRKPTPGSSSSDVHAAILDESAAARGHSRDAGSI
jgi:hypothetical protein